MRIALVSPYSWSIPGGVNQHVAALAHSLRGSGHDVQVMAPFDDDPTTAPADFTPLGSTITIPFNGAQSHVAMKPSTAFAVRRELRAGNFDVIHVHEPVAAHACRQAIAVGVAPTVGTFHTYSESAPLHAFAAMVGSRQLLNRLNARIAVSEPAAWTGRRFYGGRYTVIPNGVTVPDLLDVGERSDRFEIAFVGQAVERKGLHVLLRAFEALREAVPARLRIIGPSPEQVAPWLAGEHGVEVLGRTSDAVKEKVLAEADVLCAPSLGGESFGMILTEAFAAGTPVVASDMPGYREVVNASGGAGVLFPPGDPLALAETLLLLASQPERVREMSVAARAAAHTYAWPVVAEQVEEVYERACHVPAPATPREAAARLVGIAQGDGGPPAPPQRLPSLQPDRPKAKARPAALIGVVVAMAGIGLAVTKVPWERVVRSIIESSPAWTLVAVALMALSMAARAVSWHASLRAALPATPPSYRHVLRATSIGVLMSATLPARIGEALRVFVVSRRIGPIARIAPIVGGTVVAQLMLNLVCLAILGALSAHTLARLGGRESALIGYALVPLILIGVATLLPFLLKRATERGRIGAIARNAAHGARRGLRLFRRPRLAFVATSSQMLAWTLQWLACLVLLRSIDMTGYGLAAPAAAVLFAINVSAVLPVTPSNVGIFQAACVAVLAGGFHVPTYDAVGYGIVLQAVELATAVVMGAPSLIGEGLTWRTARSRAVTLAPVSLAPDVLAAARNES